MITPITHVIKISEIEAKKKAAFTSKDASYDKQKEELTFIVENATQKAFRLVWEDTKWFTMVQGTDVTITSTLHIIEEFESNALALDRIDFLGLTKHVPSEEKEE
jgi:hypothetical protein